MYNNPEAQIPPGMLIRIIQNKVDIIAYYERLLQLAVDEQNIDILRGIISDETTHRGLFINLYRDLFGGEPETHNNAQNIDSFIDGVKFAVMSELNNYNIYGNIFFTDGNAEVRNAFLRGLFDENSHSAKFNFIYSKFLENGLV